MVMKGSEVMDEYLESIAQEFLHIENNMVYINIEGSDFEFAADSDHIISEDWFLVLEDTSSVS